MNVFGKFLLAVTACAISISTSILVLIYGWGLEPKSFGWIIAGQFLGFMFAQIFIEAAKAK